MWVYAQYPDSRCRVYVQHSVKGRILLTKAWKKCPDKQDGSCERTVELKSKHKNIGLRALGLVLAGLEALRAVKSGAVTVGAYK